MEHIHVALLVLRLFFGVGLAAHGFNKVFGGGKLPGTARFFASIGMQWPWLQARLAAGTELGAGLLLAAGLLTPFAAAGVVGLMVVAAWVVHRANGFFITKGGWEYTAAMAIATWSVGAIGPGDYSLDAAWGISLNDGAAGAWIAALLGVGAGVAQLAICWRPGAATPAGE